MERKLATVLFVDLVESTALLAGQDPEVVRRRVGRFFEQAARCIETHGGKVEKFAGDAVMAAFGIPQAHEDDAERAVRAALGILESVAELDLQARLGIESGEVVVEDGDSTFATGEAVNLAARLQQSAEPGQILIGPGASRLAVSRVVTDDVGAVDVLGRGNPIWVRRVIGLADGAAPATIEAPLVGREAELDLLDNVFRRALRDRRAHLVTIYGDPGVGKSRLAREFTASLDRTTVLSGRCLPYGEGITYWPLAEMVKTAAGITDDDPTEAALEKLRETCEAEVVADLLGLASGILDAVEGERSRQELAWAARAWAQKLAELQPLVLVFEDIHWAEDALLDLIEHLAAWTREAPILLLCLARPELLDARPGWGGGRVRALSIQLEPLALEESDDLVQALLDGREVGGDIRELVLEKTEGNPLFIEETVRMLLEEGANGAAPARRIPDTLHALIAARIDRLSALQKTLLQRASVIGRVFSLGAVADLAPELDGSLEPTLQELLLREFLVEEPRPVVSGERALRFKHVLIRDVAYAGLPKLSRAEHHRRVAAWLKERAGDELLEFRAYHLQQACALMEELDGSCPPELAEDAAQALESAAKRALARESYETGRKLALQALDLAPTLRRRYVAARAALRLGDLPAVSTEMERVALEAEEAGNRAIHGRALAGLAQATLFREADVARARELGDRALATIDGTDDEGRYEVLDLLSTIGWWVGDLRSVKSYAQERLSIAEKTERKDLEASVLTELAGVHDVRGDSERAEPLLAKALQLADESGSIITRAWARRVEGEFHLRRDRLAEAEAAFEVSRGLFAEAGDTVHLAAVLNSLASVALRVGDAKRSEQLLREAIRLLKPLGDRGTIVESQRRLAEVLVAAGKVEEAERYALEAYRTVGPQDLSSRATTRMALGVVRGAQGRDEEAEALLREAVDIYEETDLRRWQIEPLARLVRFLLDRGREDEAAVYERRMAELSAAAPESAARIA